MKTFLQAAKKWEKISKICPPSNSPKFHMLNKWTKVWTLNIKEPFTRRTQECLMPKWLIQDKASNFSRTNSLHSWLLHHLLLSQTNSCIKAQWWWIWIRSECKCQCQWWPILKCHRWLTESILKICTLKSLTFRGRSCSSRRWTRCKRCKLTTKLSTRISNTWLWLSQPCSHNSKWWLRERTKINLKTLMKMNLQRSKRMI
jgi:hypothetical protein